MAHDKTAASTEPLLTSVLDELGRDIISGRLETGQTFTLQSIGERFQISRTVAREAMRALEQLGLVSSSRRVGITVLPRQRWSVFNPTVITWRLQTESERARQLNSLTELRVAVEPIAAYNAATAATPEQRAELKELATTMRELGEHTHGATQDFLEADMRFHSLLLEASGNEMFAMLAPSLMRALYGRTEFGLQPETPASEALDAHEELAQAIARGEAQAAESAARALIGEVRTALVPNQSA
ncbi:FadR/GntR family transcriptional regulator [Corynebacterium tapiri]|uniref:FadR family transcriptional regulator n=1 Tax=Corynebacterium tapiri TaxID=1448266 RepID=A0A5C4U3B7_9CORY|nr:FCD domain-containing protein [Corynebacterium tapiri]TNL95632.1 FadR family transcriptional regulator [Corynebacterium tapiri]